MEGKHPFDEATLQKKMAAAKDYVLSGNYSEARSIAKELEGYKFLSRYIKDLIQSRKHDF